MRPIDNTLALMIVAGEASGDAHAASLVRALIEAEPNVQFKFFGAAGPMMRAANVEPIVVADNLAIVGLVEGACALLKFWRAYTDLKGAGFQRAPDAVILVDWPDFNLRLARAFHRRRIKVIYYISPQLWAWRSYRVRNVRRDIDLLLTILPFEQGWYKQRGITQVEFVGHPLAGEVRARYGREEFCSRNGLNSSRPIIALLPGSRRHELQRILPPMLDAAVVISTKRPEVQFVLAVAPSRTLEEARQIIDRHDLDSNLRENLRLTQQETLEALAAADAAAVASGTATLEAAMVGTPLVVVYKESALNWHLLGRLISTDHFGLINLVARERIVTELMQNELNGERLAEELVDLLNEQRNKQVRGRLQEATALLGAGGASRRAADVIIEAIRKWKLAAAAN